MTTELIREKAISEKRLQEAIDNLHKNLKQKIVPTLWFPSRFLEDFLRAMPENCKVNRIQVDGTVWGSNTYRPIDSMLNVKIYEQLSPSRRATGVIQSPSREQLEKLLEKVKQYAIRLVINQCELEIDGRIYYWQFHRPKKESALGSEASKLRFSRGFQKARGGQMTVLDLKSTHDIPELVHLFKVFNGYAHIRLCSVQKGLKQFTDAVCLDASALKEDSS